MLFSKRYSKLLFTRCNDFLIFIHKINFIFLNKYGLQKIITHRFITKRTQSKGYAFIFSRPFMNNTCTVFTKKFLFMYVITRNTQCIIYKQGKSIYLWYAVRFELQFMTPFNTDRICHSRLMFAHIF